MLNRCAFWASRLGGSPSIGRRIGAGRDTYDGVVLERDQSPETVWQRLQREWEYPTIIGAHDELARWEYGLRDLAERLEATIPYLARDLKRLPRERLPEDVAYSQNQVYLVTVAADLLRQAYDLSLSRFST